LNFVKDISDFYKFLVNPVYNFKKHNPLGFASLFSLYFFTFFIVIVVSPLLLMAGVEELPHAMEEILERFTKWQLFLLAVIIMPLLEELFFRAHLGFGFWKKINFGYPFYLTAVIFAFAHVFNFSLDASKWYLGPLLVLPQMILGLFLGYIRVRNNLLTSIFFHSFHNGLAFTAMLFAPEGM